MSEGAADDGIAPSPAIDSPSPIDNRLFVLILQHPHERREALATAAATCALLRRSLLKTGLSWRNLGHALGRPAESERWGVLYLGAALAQKRAPGAPPGTTREVTVLDRAGAPLADAQAVLHRLEGVVVLDGTWKEAKTLWWRNPWLLKLHRLVLDPRRPSRYGALRREPRPQALSTLEATALLLRHREGAEAEAPLLAALDRKLAANRPLAPEPP